MKLPFTSKTLLVCAAIGIGLCPGRFEAWAQSCPNGQFLASNIVELTNAPNFQPEQYASCEINPGDNTGCTGLAPQTASPPTQYQYAQQIADAINNSAPSSLKRQLCTLNHIYIDKSGRNTAWGMREFTTKSNGARLYTGQHIGISDNLFNYLLNNPAAPFSAYQSYIAHILLTPPPSVQIPQPTPPTSSTMNWLQGVIYTGTANDNMTMAILGVLAHEMGHIIYVTQIQNKTLAPSICTSPGTQHHFHQYSWNGAGHVFIFHKFGGLDVQHPSIRTGTLSDILTDIQNNDIVKAGSALQTLYGGKEWGSLLATVSADEDFVETYMLSQLKIGNILTTLPVLIPATTAQPAVTIDIMQGFAGNSLLAQKAAWIDQCIH